MEQKYLKTNLPYRYKFEMYGNAYNGTGSSAGTLKITDYNGNVIYDLETGDRGHTLFGFYIDDKKLTLNKNVTYDSYGKGDTTGILDEMQSTTSASSHLYVILSQDAITNDSSFVNRMKAYGCNKDVSCYRQRRGFIAFLHHSGIYYRSDYEGYFLDTSDVVISKNNQESVNLTEYILDMRTARYGIYTPCVILRFIRNPILYSRIYSSTDTSRAIGRPIYSKTDTQIINQPITLKSGYTYHVRVRFRGRGNGTPTSSKCSSLGFIAWTSDWSTTFGYIHYSSYAYNEIGQIVDWTYEFIPDADYSCTWALFFIVDNYFGNGTDNQTIDLYYYDFWYTDPDGNNVRIKSEGYKSTSSYPSEPKQNFLKLNNSNYLILHNKNNYGRFFGKFKVNKTYSISDTLERLSYLDMEELTYDSYNSFESGSDATESGFWKSYQGNNNLNTLCSYVY